MYKYFSILVIAATMLGASLEALTEINLDLQNRLVDLGYRDQAIREKIGPVIASAGMESDEFRKLAKEMSATDQENLLELKKIIDEYGWPGESLVGLEASKSAFLILQHAPLPDQERFLPIFKKAVSEGEALGRNLALLEDRVRISKGLKQIYGSQVSSGPDGKPRLDPIENPKELNQRRAGIGLPPIEEQLKIMEEQLGKEIDRTALEAK